MRAITIHDAMTFVVFKCSSFQSMREVDWMSLVILPVMGSGKRIIREPAGLRSLVPPLLNGLRGLTRPHKARTMSALFYGRIYGADY